MAAGKSDTGPLELIGWSFESAPRHTLAKLRDSTGDVTYIGVQHLITAPEMFGRLSAYDQRKVMVIVLVTGVAA